MNTAFLFSFWCNFPQSRQIIFEIVLGKKKGSPESLLDWGLTDLQIIILKEAAGAFGDEQIGFGGCRERRGGSFCHSKSHFSFGLAAGRCAAAAPLHSNDGGEKEQLLAQRTFPSTLLFP